MSSERLFGASTSTTTRTRTVEGGLAVHPCPELRTPNSEPELRTALLKGCRQSR